MNLPDGMTRAHHAYLNGQEHDTRCPCHPDQPGYICREQNASTGQPCGNILSGGGTECGDCGISSENSDGDWTPEPVDMSNDCRCEALAETAAERGMGL